MAARRWIFPFLRVLLSLGFTVAISNCTLSTNIKDLDSGVKFPRVKIYDVSVNEGETAAFVISLTHPAPAPVVVAVQSLNVTAFAGADYTGIIQFVTIAKGGISGIVDINTTEDFNYELGETFEIEISAATNATLSTVNPKKTVTIVDDENKPKLFVSDVTNGEGATLTFTASIDVPSELPVSFDFATLPGVAQDPTDYAGIKSAAKSR